jgi:hypothetical protein
MQSLHKGDLALQQGAHFRGEAAWACTLPASQQCTAGQHGALQHRTERAHGAVRTLRPLALTDHRTGELQHGVVRYSKAPP